MSLYLSICKANNKYIKSYDKNKESSYLQYWDVINFCGSAMFQKPPANNFEWIKDTSQFNEDFMKNNSEASNEWFVFEVNVQYFENIQELHND